MMVGSTHHGLVEALRGRENTDTFQIHYPINLSYISPLMERTKQQLLFCLTLRENLFFTVPKYNLL